MQAGLELGDYVRERIEEPAKRGEDLGEDALRRLAIATLLDYIATGSEDSLNASLYAARDLAKRLDRVENRYWIHYIRAHAALHEGEVRDFNREVLDLWLEVMALEAPYDTYRMLSLRRAPNAGFVAALPYVYENVARLIVIRAPQMGVVRGIDPLAGVVRSLADGRVGLDPEIIPAAVSAADYVGAVAERLQGPESDGQSLSFTLGLLEAEVAHERMRERLASDGFSQATLESIHVSVGAYERALARASTLQGQAAVYTRALRQVGELFAAKRRLGEDPHLLVPFSIERAMEIYAVMDRQREDWERQGYRNTVGRPTRRPWPDSGKSSRRRASTWRSTTSAAGSRAGGRATVTWRKPRPVTPATCRSSAATWSARSPKACPIRRTLRRTVRHAASASR